MDEPYTDDGDATTGTNDDYNRVDQLFAPLVSDGGEHSYHDIDQLFAPGTSARDDRDAPYDPTVEPRETELVDQFM